MYVSVAATFKISALYLYITQIKVIIAVKFRCSYCTVITEVNRHYCF